MSEYKYAAIKGSKVYHEEGDYALYDYCQMFRTKCGVFVYQDELRKSKPKGKRLCKRCKKAMKKRSK